MQGHQRYLFPMLLKKRLEIAEELGFIPVNPEKENLEKVVKDATNGEGCDAFFECSGAAKSAGNADDRYYKSPRKKICIVSVHKKTTRSELKRSEFQKNRQWLEQEYIRKKNSEELQNLQKKN